MSDPNDKQKCATCQSLKGWTEVGGYWMPCPDCAPRADGSAAEVKRYRVREGRTPSCPDYYVDSEIVDEEVVLASDYDALLSRVAELERDAARLKLQHSELATAANNLLTRKLGINEERLVLRVRESDFDALCAALSKGAQP